MTQTAERQTAKGAVYKIPVRAIVANTNPRFPLSGKIESLGYRVFESTPDGKGGTRPSIWELATSDDAEKRKEFVDLVSEHDEEFTSWAATFVTQGQLQAVEVRDNGRRGKTEDAANTYTLVFGCRRCLAILFNWCLTGKPAEPMVEARLAKGNNSTLLQRAFVENRRLQPNPIEEAASIQQWLNMTSGSIEQAASEFGYTGQTIRNRLALLELDEKAQKKIREGTLRPSKALAHRETGGEPAEPEIVDPSVNGESPVASAETAEAPAAPPRMRSRKTIEEAAAEFSDQTPAGKVLAWVLGKRESLT